MSNNNKATIKYLFEYVDPATALEALETLGLEAPTLDEEELAEAIDTCIGRHGNGFDLSLLPDVPTIHAVCAEVDGLRAEKLVTREDAIEQARAHISDSNLERDDPIAWREVMAGHLGALNKGGQLTDAQVNSVDY